MSETVHYKGTLREVYRHENDTLEGQCKRILNGSNKELDIECYDSYKEMLLDEGYYDYIILDDILYSVNKQNIDPDNDVFNMSEEADGTFNFEVKYYNGGCSFIEAIECAFENKK